MITKEVMWVRKVCFSSYKPLFFLYISNETYSISLSCDFPLRPGSLDRIDLLVLSSPRFHSTRFVSFFGYWSWPADSDLDHLPGFPSSFGKFSNRENHSSSLPPLWLNPRRVQPPTSSEGPPLLPEELIMEANLTLAGENRTCFSS